MFLFKNEYPDCLILEIGADHPGDIRKIAKWLRVDIVVVTKISQTPVHVEFFKSPLEVFEEKASIIQALKQNGTLVLYGDDPKIIALNQRVEGKGIKVYSYGLNESATVHGLEQSVTYSKDEGNWLPTGVFFNIKIKDCQEMVSVTSKNIVGQAYIYPLLAAVATAYSLGIKPEKINADLNKFLPPRGRMNLIPGINGSVIIDDTYNSSPDAAKAALETLKSLESSSSLNSVNPLIGQGGKKIAILGDMMELGKYAADEHRKVGKEAASVVSDLITVGMRSRMTAEEALKNGMPSESVRSFDKADEVAGYVGPMIKSGDVILVKGSQSIRMEKVVKALMKEPERAGDLLVRQEKEWLEKK